MSTYKAARQLCGLSQADASDFHQVSIDTIKAWDKGRSIPKDGVWKELASLWAQIEDAADMAASVMEDEGIDIRAYANIEAERIGHDLPMEGARNAAGAMGLLILLSELQKRES